MAQLTHRAAGGDVDVVGLVALRGRHDGGIEASWTLPQKHSNEQIPDTDNDWCRSGSGVCSDVLLLHDALARFAVPGVGAGWQQPDMNTGSLCRH